MPPGSQDVTVFLHRLHLCVCKSVFVCLCVCVCARLCVFEVYIYCMRAPCFLQPVCFRERVLRYLRASRDWDVDCANVHLLPSLSTPPTESFMEPNDSCLFPTWHQLTLSLQAHTHTRTHSVSLYHTHTHTGKLTHWPYTICQDIS